MIVATVPCDVSTRREEYVELLPVRCREPVPGAPPASGESCSRRPTCGDALVLEELEAVEPGELGGASFRRSETPSSSAVAAGPWVASSVRVLCPRHVDCTRLAARVCGDTNSGGFGRGRGAGSGSASRRSAFRAWCPRHAACSLIAAAVCGETNSAPALLYVGMMMSPGGDPAAGPSRHRPAS